MTSLQIIGGGRMGTALLDGLIAAGWTEPASLRVVETDEGRRADLSVAHPTLEVTDHVGDADGTLLAVKPVLVPAVAAPLGDVRSGRVLSVAAGVTTSVIEDAIGDPVPVVRAMPNTPALVGAGASAVAPGRHAGAEDLAWATGILGSVGVVVEVTEAQLDAVTGLSGSGPAYLFLVAEALVEAGVHQGLARPIAAQLAYQTVLGAGRLLSESDDEPAALRAAVTSPAGTTAAGLHVLEERGVRSAMQEAVIAAADRSRELGR